LVSRVSLEPSPRDSVSVRLVSCTSTEPGSGDGKKAHEPGSGDWRNAKIGRSWRALTEAVQDERSPCAPTGKKQVRALAVQASKQLH
jgi:hypothetical protein